MTETICTNCGNRKSFSDDKIGKKFKCPNCGEVVAIQSKSNNEDIVPVTEVMGIEAGISKKEIVPVAGEKPIETKSRIEEITRLATNTPVELTRLKTEAAPVVENDTPKAAYPDAASTSASPQNEKSSGAKNKLIGLVGILVLAAVTGWFVLKSGSGQGNMDISNNGNLATDSAAAPAPTAPPVSSLAPARIDSTGSSSIVKSYSGNVGKLQTSYTLTWNSDGTINGTYYYPERTDTTYTLKGIDVGNGSIQLAEYTGDKLTANCFLSLQGTCYEGQMNNADGRQLNMTICPNNSVSGNLSKYNYTGIVASVGAQGNRGMNYLSIKTLNGSDESFLINDAKIFKEGKEVNFSLLIEGTKVGVIGVDEAERIDILDYGSKTDTKIQGKYPQATGRLLSPSDLNGIGKEDLKIMRNEIFARHGYIFRMPDMISYFSQQVWYHGQYEDVNSLLSEIEKQNVELIEKYE